MQVRNDVAEAGVVHEIRIANFGECASCDVEIYRKGVELGRGQGLETLDVPSVEYEHALTVVGLIPIEIQRGDRKRRDLDQKSGDPVARSTKRAPGLLRYGGRFGMWFCHVSTCFEPGTPRSDLRRRPLPCGIAVGNSVCAAKMPTGSEAREPDGHPRAIACKNAPPYNCDALAIIATLSRIGSPWG